MLHKFHIPVLGIGYSIDTPIKVAKYGISSVASIVDDFVAERMRAHYLKLRKQEYHPIPEKDDDHRSKRITAYLDLMKEIIDEDFATMRRSSFSDNEELNKYFNLLPDFHPLKERFLEMQATENLNKKSILETELKQEMRLGSIDVNIMSKVDKLNYSANGDLLGHGFSDALAAFRGFAESKLNSSLIISAGMNPRLYSFIEEFSDFFPDEKGITNKKIILKVSDYRSALIQAKLLAKKGIWVSEFRIESGLNCGGHAFATQGFLLGPILAEFKDNRTLLVEELYSIYQRALTEKGNEVNQLPKTKVSVQGGIGTAQENQFLLDYYEMDATGWGSPFLLVPEATNVDEETLQNMIQAKKEDFYLSNSSPLGVPIHNFRGSSMDKLRLERIAKGKPGSPCVKKLLISDTEFTKKPICTASRSYQSKKIKQLDSLQLSENEYKEQFDAITEKACLCEGLSSSLYIKNDMLEPKERNAVSICPGPNTAYFSSVFSLEQMVQHIYGKLDLLGKVGRPNMFLNELDLYIEYLKKDFQAHQNNLNDKKAKYLKKFKEQLEEGIQYYKDLIPKISNQTEEYLNKMIVDLIDAERKLIALPI